MFARRLTACLTGLAAIAALSACSATAMGDDPIKTLGITTADLIEEGDPALPETVDQIPTASLTPSTGADGEPVIATEAVVPVAAYAGAGPSGPLASQALAAATPETVVAALPGVEPEAAAPPAAEKLQSVAVPVDAIERVSSGPIAARSPELDALIARYAQIHGIPESLLRRVVNRESTFNPAARNGPYWGQMQIRHDTARGMGYRGPAEGLLDAETNLIYAGKYLRGAYLVANGDHDMAVRHYSRGYYYHARDRGMLEVTGLGRDRKRRR